MKMDVTEMRYCVQCFNWMNNFEFTSRELSLSKDAFPCSFCDDCAPIVRKITPSGWSRYFSSQPHRSHAYLRSHLPSAQPVSGATLMGYYYNAMRHWIAVRDDAAERAESAQYGLAGSVARFERESRAKWADDTTEDKRDGLD